MRTEVAVGDAGEDGAAEGAGLSHVVRDWRRSKIANPMPATPSSATAGRWPWVEAFQGSEWGYEAALSTVLFVLALLHSVIIFRFRREETSGVGTR